MQKKYVAHLKKIVEAGMLKYHNKHDDEHEKHVEVKQDHHNKHDDKHDVVVESK